MRSIVDVGRISLSVFIGIIQNHPLVWEKRANTYTYNAAGQVLTATNPRGETTTFNYDSNGYVLNIDGPLPGTNDTTRFTYDAYGHRRTTTDSEGYTLTYDYDALDRLTRTTYPDGTYEQKVYDRLDLGSARDRNGRITQYSHDGNRRLVADEDPLQRITRYEWCACGQMEALTDPMGHTTQWHRDIEGRVIAKEYVDGSQVRYAYEGSTGRLKSVKDEKGQVKLYDYWLDNNLKTLTYLNAENPTPNVTFTYDAAYNRIASMEDGTGLTRYGYYSAATNAGKLAFVDGPLSNDTVTYDYDELGRVQTRAIDGVAQNWMYDALGRVTLITNVLGIFTNTYVNATFRPASELYPNGQRIDYSYYDNLGDQRLQQIRNQLPGDQPLSLFQYAYDPSGQITNWVQQADNATPENWALAYDPARQLLSALITTNGSPSKSYNYGYDAAGNRLLEQIDGTRHNFTYNALNQIESADDPTIPSVSCQWDGENRLVGITQDTNRYEITYDGEGRYVEIKRLNGTTLASDERYLWCANDVCEIRDPSGSAAHERILYGGYTLAESSFFSSRDHLNTLRFVTDANGNRVESHAYDPFGNPIDVVAAPNSGIAFTGHFLLQGSSLLLTRHRPYVPALARWLSRDPLMESVGHNLFSYVNNNPMNETDPLGLAGDGGNQAALNAALAAIQKACSSNPEACGANGAKSIQNQLNALMNQAEGWCKENPATCAASAAAAAAAIIASGSSISIPVPLPKLPLKNPSCSLDIKPGSVSFNLGWTF